MTALLVFPAGFLIAIGDEMDPLEHSKRVIRKNARASSDLSKLRSRLAELGRETDEEYEAFRIRQYGFCLGAAALLFILQFSISKNLFISLISGLITSTIMYVMLDRNLTREVNKRRELIEAEFPAIVEMLTLAIAAGETPMSAILRIAESAEGELAREFHIVVAGVRAGTPLNETLDALGRRVNSVVIRRFVDALITATLRGAPLVDVLSRHAAEARANQRNRVMGAAGKAEISMMIPVVFLILPISILFALWPSLSNLNMFSS